MTPHFGRRRSAASPSLSPRLVHAQPAWPTRPVRIVVAYAPGGGTDITTRAFAEALGQRFGQTFVVENRPGANGVVGTEAVARAPADGYTLLAVTSTHVMNRQMVSRCPSTRRPTSPRSG